MGLFDFLRRPKKLNYNRCAIIDAAGTPLQVPSSKGWGVILPKSDCDMRIPNQGYGAVVHQVINSRSPQRKN